MQIYTTQIRNMQNMSVGFHFLEDRLFSWNPALTVRLHGMVVYCLIKQIV
jgi:hypothetical protein